MDKQCSSFREIFHELCTHLCCIQIYTEMMEKSLNFKFVFTSSHNYEYIPQIIVCIVLANVDLFYLLLNQNGGK